MWSVLGRERPGRREACCVHIEARGVCPDDVWHRLEDTQALTVALKRERERERERIKII